jgi:acetylornithine/LysW-gamma-L-lysine aminotransferase
MLDSLPGAPAVARERELGPGLWNTRDVTFVRGEGARLWDDHGRAYIDCAAGYGVASLGHAHPALLGALHEQAARLISCTPSYGNDQRRAYYEELLDALPAGAFQRVFLCNSGTEAIEAALKFARLSTGRPNVIACMRGFHGRTLGALSATHDRKYREPFAPLVPGFSHVAYGNVEALEAALDEDTAAVVLEVVQGEGGVRPASPEFLRAAERLCRERGALLIVDEVQTGFGRTGRLFAIEHTGLAPDLLCLAKGIAGGIPMGAVALGERVAELPAGSHGSTFGGNPLACAAARAVLRALRAEGLVERAEVLGMWLRDRLRELDSTRVREVRGLGLMVGIELKERVAPYLDRLLERGVVALPAGPTVLRLLPPLVIGPEDLEEVVDVLGEVLA